MSLNCLMDLIPYQIFKITLSKLLRSMKLWLVSQQGCTNQVLNRNTFKVKSGYYLELLTTETIKLLGSAEEKITQDKTIENTPLLKITKVALGIYYILNTKLA